MPRLRQVLPDIFFDTSMSHPDVVSLLDVEVREVKLNTGSPCDGHAAMFADWPGDGNYVRQWYILANGKAVAVNEEPNRHWQFPVVDYEEPR